MRPPSSIRRRVRARRACTQVRVSKRAWVRSVRISAAVVQCSAAVVAWSARSSVAGAVRLCPSLAAKEALAPLLPHLLGARIGLGPLDRIEEHTGEGFEIQSVAAGCCDQLAELGDALEFQRALLVLKRLQLGIDVARLAHRCLPPV